MIYIIHKLLSYIFYPIDSYKQPDILEHLTSKHQMTQQFYLIFVDSYLNKPFVGHGKLQGQVVDKEGYR